MRELFVMIVQEVRGKALIMENQQNLMKYEHTYNGTKGSTYNVLQLTEVGVYEAQNLNIKRMSNRSRNVDITTKPPILVRCCYVPFFFTNIN